MRIKMEDLILNGRCKVIEKRQKEIAPKLKEIIDKYEKLIEQNKTLFNEYHNSFSNDKTKEKIPEVIKFFSDEINKLDLNEYDLELIIDKEKNLSLIDYIINNKIYLSLNYFSIGGSNAKLGYKLLKKIFLSNDKEYIKYLPLVGFKGSPELFLREINGKKIIDYLIDNYELFNKCNFKINDYKTKQYIINNISKYINDKNKDKLYQILDMINFSVLDLINDINVNGKLTNIIGIYLNNNILKDSDKLNNIIIPNKILLNLIYKYIDTCKSNLKKEIRKCINNLYVDDNFLNKINKRLIDYLIGEKIFLRKQELNNNMSFNEYIKELELILKTGTPTSQEMIDYVKSNYYNMYINNETISLKEIKTIIIIKKNHPNFHIEDSNVGPNFDNDTLHLVISDKHNLGWHKEDNYATFNHEMTHAIQYYCFNDDTPQEFYSLLPNIKKIVKNIANYCVTLIDKMNNNIKNENNIERERLVSNLSLNKYSYEREVVDIFDSIMCFTDTLMQLEYPNADFIEGHPYDYMKYGGYDFSEILADYKSIWCSSRYDLYKFVKDNLGNECSFYIESFYEKVLDNYIALYYKKDKKLVDKKCMH